MKTSTGRPAPLAARRFLEQLRRRLRREMGMRAGVGAVAGATLVWTLDLALGLSLAGRGAAVQLTLLAAAGLLGAAPMLTRLLRGEPSLEKAAREGEARAPGGEHLLPTLATLPGVREHGDAERNAVQEAFLGRALLRLGDLDARTLLPLRFGSEWKVAAGAIGLAVAVLLSSPEGWRSGPGGEGSAAEAGEATPPGAIVPEGAAVELRTVVHLVPPAYSGLPSVTLDDPEVVEALPGTRLRVEVFPGGAVAGAELLGVEEAPGAPGAEALAIERSRGGFEVAWELGVRPRALALLGAGADELPPGTEPEPLRMLPVIPRPDLPPVVELIEPERDLVVATGTGSIRLRAIARDPFGVDSMTLSWTHTRGGGESFAFREGRVEGVALTRSEAGVLEGVVDLPLEELQLGPGDVVHLRAEAVDRNRVTGPGRGASPVRIVRVARDDDDPEVNTLIGFPLESEREPVLSQRMIILLTEELLDRAPELSPGEFRTEGLRIADEQARLRSEVGEQIFSRATGAMREPDRFLGDDHDHGDDLPSWIRGEASGQADDHAHPPEDLHPPGDLRGFTENLEGGVLGLEPELPGHDHDGDPILSVNPGLLEAFNYMRSAERDLRLAELRASLVHQYHALDELQALREGIRVYPRGRVAAPPIDVAATRGTGDTSDARPEPRPSGPDRGGERLLEEGLEQLIRSLADLSQGEAARRLAALTGEALAGGASEVEASVHLAAALERYRGGRPEEALERLRVARDLLYPTRGGGSARPEALPIHAAEAAYLEALAGPTASNGTPAGRGGAWEARPFVFATARYRSGNWDSAPLVPTNLHHTIARYTDIPVAAEGDIVDLAAPELHRYPFVFLTGHLPVRFTPEESRNVERYVESGGFLFIDDHNHDVDGAFHRTVTEELARIFGDDALQPVPKDHRLYRAFFHFEDGPPVTSHELSGWGDGLIHPELFAIHVDGRMGVLYSNKDYASEWNYHAVNKRFLALDNTRFGLNVILFALTR